MMAARQYSDLLNKSVSNVLATMSFIDVAPGPPIESHTTILNLDISASVCLAGEVSGLIAIHCSKAFARQCFELISGGDEEPGEEDLCDTAGELANMIAGTLKREISSAIDLFFISLPCVTLSDNLRVFYSGAKDDFPRLLIPYQVDEEETFYVEMLYHKR